ncbi:MAG: PASTA domain-containing protein [Terrabacter sp.]
MTAWVNACGKLPTGCDRVPYVTKWANRLTSAGSPTTMRRPNSLQEATTMSIHRKLPAVAIAIVAVAATAGCGSNAAPASTAATVVVTQTVATPAAETVTQTVQATASAAQTSAEPVEVSAPPAPKPPAKVTVPDGVGMNYQQAQDAWRAAGLHVAPANDATGANRVPVLDRNWVVLAQDLKAGSKVARDSFITATIKKYTDG